MARAVSAALLAAAQGLRGRPIVRVDVEDRAARWALHATGAPSVRLTDAVGVGSALHRVLLQGTLVRYARLGAPEEPASWPGAWTTVAADADGDADVALAAYDALRLSAFYHTTAGKLARVDSADGGATWGAPAACCDWDYAPTRIAAAGRVCAWSRPGAVQLAVTRDDLGGPAWLPVGAYEPPGGFAQCRGLALCRDGAHPDLYYLVAALDGALYGATYDEPAREFGETHRIVPPGSAGTPSTSQASDPSAVSTDEGLCVAFVDRVGVGDLAHWAHPTVLWSRHYPHLARQAVLAMGQPGATRAALGVSGGAVYAAYENAACRAELWSAGALARNLRDLEPARYALRATARGSRLEVTLPGAEGDLAALGEPESPLGPVRPGARLIVRRGYLTAEGPEAVALPPHHVVEARAERDARGARMHLTAVDGRGLLELVRPAEVATWTGRTIRELLAALCGLAGLGYADAGEAALGRTLARYTLGAGEPLARGVDALLALGGAVAFCDASGTLQARVLAEHLGPPLPLGDGDEVLEREHAIAGGGPGIVRVYGEGVVAASAPGAQSMDGELALYESVVDHRASDAATAAALAAFHALLGRMAGHSVSLAVPLRPDLELWDRVELPESDPLPGVRRVAEIAEEYVPSASRYVSRLVLRPAE